MFEWIMIILLILGGITLIVVEIILIPGTTVVGFIGFALGCYGIFHSYELFGDTVGNTVLGVSFVFGMTAIIVSFRSNAWRKLALNDSITSKVNENMTIALVVGQEGISISSLKPVGKVEFDNKQYEATSLGNYIEENTAVRIVKIDRNKIIIEPVN